MKKYISYLLLAAVLSAGMVSCASDDTNNPKEETAETTTLAVETEIDQEQLLYADLPQLDFGGTAINILGYRTSNTYTDSEFYEADQTGESIDDALYFRNLETEQHLNIDLVYNYPDGDRDTCNKFKNSVIAGDNSFDMFAIKAVYFGSIVTSDTAMPWNDIEGLYLDKPWYIKGANDILTVNDKRYGVLTDALGTNMTMCWTYVFNKQLAAEWNIEDPYTLVREGKWTMDTLYSLTKDVYQDLNGSNTADADDLYGFYTDSYATEDAFMVSHGITTLGKDEDDLLVIDFYSDRVVSSIESVNRLYWDNPGAYVDKELPYEYRARFAAGQAVFSPMLLTYLIESELREMEDDYGVLPYPKLDEAQEDYYTHLLGRTGTFILPKTLTEEKTGMVGHVVEVLSAYSYQYLRPAIYDVTLTNKGVRDEESLEMLTMIMDRRTYDFSMFLEQGISFPFSPGVCYRNLIAANNNNITSYYEKNLSGAEKTLKTLTDTILSFDD